MSGMTGVDVELTARLGVDDLVLFPRRTVGSDVVVYVDVRARLTGEVVTGLSGVSALYHLSVSSGEALNYQPLTPIEVVPGTWDMTVPAVIPGVYTVWFMIGGQAIEVQFHATSAGQPALTSISTGTAAWADVQAVGAAAGASAALPEARRVALEVGASAGALAAPAAALAAIAPQVALVDADAMAVELSRQQVAAAVQAVPAQAVAAATPAGADAGTAAANVVVGSKLDKAGGTLTGPLVLSGAATTDLQATTKAQLDAATISLPHSNSITGRSIPSSVTSVFVQGFAAQGDGGESGPWVVVATQPTHTAWRTSADGRVWELQTRTITPRAFGARGDGTNQLTQITNMFAYAYAKYIGVFGDQYPNGIQPVIEWGPGRFRAAGLVFNAPQTGVVWRGVAGATLLDGIVFEFGGFRQTLENLQFMDIRGILPDIYAVKMTNAARRQARIHNVQIRDKEIGLWLSEGSVSNFNQISIERCGIGILALGAGDITLANLMVTNNAFGLVNKGTGEIKGVGGHIYGNDTNVVFEGDDRVSTLECYWTNVTMSNTAISRVLPVIRVENNGSGGARAIVSENLTITSAVAATAAYLERGQRWRLADTSFLTTGSGTLTDLAVAGTSLLSASVTWTGSTAGAAAIAAAINAGTGTHGYTSTSASNRFWIFSPGMFNGIAANGRQVTWATSSGSLTPRPHTKITTATEHGYAAGDAVEFNASGNANYNGVAIIAWVDSATEFTITGAAVTFASGKVARALRVEANESNLTTTGFSVGAYNQSVLNILAVGPGYVDLGSGITGSAVAFTTTSTGNIIAPNWGVQMISHDLPGRVNDQYFTGGNINRLLTIGCYGVSMVGQRVKEMWWMDSPVLPSLGGSMMEKIGLGPGRNASVVRWQMPTGMPYGWGYLGMIDATSLEFLPTPFHGPGLLTPLRSAGIVNGRVAGYSIVQALEDGPLLAAGATTMRLLPGGMVIPGVLFANLTAPASAAGCTLRVIDRNNRLVTSDGTAWRDQTGTVLA